MASGILGTLTIGQAPRLDVTPILDRYIPDSVRRIDRGLLDGLSRGEIAARYGAEAGKPVLVTRLLDGSSVELSARKVQGDLQAKLDALEDDGCTVILLLCTGTFHDLRCKRGWLIEPDQVIPQAVSALVRGRRLGIVVPVASQMTSESGKWQALARAPIFAAASPYADTLATLAAAGLSLKGQGAEALLLDCIGFTEQHRRALREATGLPAILSNALLAKVAGELVAA